MLTTEAVSRMNTPVRRAGWKYFSPGKIRVLQFINGGPVTIAALNASWQTVVSGPSEAVECVVNEARSAQVATAELNRRFAFHSPLMGRVVEPFASRLQNTEFSRPRVQVFSTVTGGRLSPDVDLAFHLASQLTTAVRFHEAFEMASEGVDLWIEVGAGRVLSGLATAPRQVVSMEAESLSLRPFLRTLAMAFVHGHDLRLASLYSDRSMPEFDLDWIPRFFTSPCERPAPAARPAKETSTAKQPSCNVLPSLRLGEADHSAPPGLLSPVDAVRHAIAQRKGSGFASSKVRDEQTRSARISAWIR